MTAPIDKVALVCIRDRQILITRSLGKDRYYIPGGKREGGESDLDCLVREVREELRVGVVTSSVRFVGRFVAQAHGHATGTLVCMTCYRAEVDGTPEPDNEIVEIQWFSYADRDRVSPVDQLIFDFLRERGNWRARRGSRRRATAAR